MHCSCATHRGNALPRPVPQRWRRDLMLDPQTSGGLLVAVEEGAADEVLALMRQQGLQHAARIGTLSAGSEDLPAGTVRVDP
jgi:selenide,water dikinase